MFYRLLRQVFFQFPPEAVHYFAMDAFRVAGPLLGSYFHPRDRPKDVWGLRFRNPVGLGAGFDKNARYLDQLDLLGFGFVEVGTVTPKAQPGNDKPRLFRLPKDKALINRMGFNNEGADAVARRLTRWREKGSTLIVGGNIGKNKDTPNEDAWKDYAACFDALRHCVDYFVVNVSSPNTPGLRALQGKEALRGILGRLQDINRDAKPLLLKIAPDLSLPETDDILELARTCGLSGLVATNTTVSREGLRTPAARVAAMGSGGLSGAPLRQPTTEFIRYIHGRTGGTLPIIGSGGIFTGADAREKMDAGATLVQVWTGFIYEGPAIAKKICTGLKE